MKTARYLFIVGAGRSGTSLLQAIISAHSSVVSKQEDQFLRNNLFDNKFRNYQKIFDSADNFLATKITEFRKKFDAHNHESYTLLEKDPRLIEHADRIFDNFDDTLVIEIYRHPVMVLRSRRVAEWSKGRSIIIDVLTTYLHQSLGLYWSTALGKRYIRINYEDLLINFEETINPIMQRIGYSVTDEQRNYYCKSSWLIKNGERSWKKNIENPLLVEKANIDDKQFTRMEKLILAILYRAQNQKLSPRFFFIVAKLWLIIRK